MDAHRAADLPVAHLRAARRASQAHVGGVALALLFARSGWTQEELAAKEGKNQSWVTRRLRFGRFLHFLPSGIKTNSLPEKLTEGRFRSLWEQTAKSSKDEPRFRQVLTRWWRR